MFGHDDVADDGEVVSCADRLEGLFEGSFGAGLVQESKALMAAEGDEV